MTAITEPTKTLPMMAVANIINNNFLGFAVPPSSTGLVALAANSAGKVINMAITMQIQEMIAPERVASSPAISIEPALFPVYR